MGLGAALLETTPARAGGPADASPASRLWLPVVVRPGTAAPERVAQIGGLAWAVALDDHWAFVGVGAQLRVLDVADMGTPREVARSDLGQAVIDVIFEAGRIYVQTSRGVQLFEWDGETLWRDGLVAGYGIMAVSGTTLYLAQLYQLVIHDVRDPRRPERVGEMELRLLFSGDTPPCSVVVQGGTALVAFDVGVLLVDVRDPRHPVQRGATPSGACSVHAAPSGAVGLAYYNSTRPEWQLARYDLTHPEKPAVWVGATVCDGGEAADLAVQQAIVAVVCAGPPVSLEFRDLDESRAPLRDRLLLGRSGDDWGARRVTWQGQRLALVGSGLALGLVETDRARPRSLRSLELAADAAGAVAASDGRAWVAFSAGGYDGAAASELVGLDLDGASVPQVTDRIAVAGTIRALAMVRDRLLVAVQDGGGSDSAGSIALFARRTARWRLVRRLPLSSHGEALVAIGGNCAVQTANGQVRIITLSESDALALSEPLPVPPTSRPSRIAADGGYLLVYTDGTSPGDRLVLFDAADPARPRLVGSVPGMGTDSFAGGLVVGEGRAYVSNYWSFTTIELVSPQAPRVLAIRPMPYGRPVLAVEGRRLLMGGPVQVLDVADPLWPQPEAPEGPETWGPAVIAGRWVLVAEGVLGLSVLSWPPAR
jgi:hypothetical protein